MLLWPDESGFRAWGSEISAANLTIAKVQRSACGLVCADVGIMRLRACGTRSGVGRKRKKHPRGQESSPRCGICERGSSVIFAKRFGLVCGGVFAAAVVQACRQIRQSLARQVPFGALLAQWQQQRWQSLTDTPRAQWIYGSRGVELPFTTITSGSIDLGHVDLITGGYICIGKSMIDGH